MVGGLVGIVLPLLAKAFPKHEKWIPSAAGLGLAWTFHWYNALLFFLGAVIAYWLGEEVCPSSRRNSCSRWLRGSSPAVRLMAVLLIFWENGPQLMQATLAYVEAHSAFLAGLRHAVQELAGANEQLAVADGRRAAEIAAAGGKMVLGQELEFRSRGIDKRRRPIARGNRSCRRPARAKSNPVPHAAPASATAARRRAAPPGRGPPPGPGLCSGPPPGAVRPGLLPRNGPPRGRGPGNRLARGGVEAIAAAAVDEVDALALQHGRADPRTLLAPPENVGLGNVALAAGPNGYRAAAARPGLQDVDDPVAGNRAGADRIGIESLAVPSQFARIGIEAQDLVGHGNHQVGAALAAIDQHRRAPGAGETAIFVSPDFLAGLLIQGHQRLALGHAGTITRFLYRIGLDAVPQPRDPEPVPTLVCHSFLPSRSKASTPVLPKKT